MRVDVFTIFPGYLEGSLRSSLLGRARERGLVDVRVHDPREHTTDPHRSVDDTPFGGGAGMVMTPEPLFAAVEAVKPLRPLLLLSAAGTRFDQRMAERLATRDGFSLVCGRYEGVDQRVADHLCDDEIAPEGNRILGARARAVVEHVTHNVAEEPEAVEIDVEERRDDVQLLVHASPSDMGRLIGKRGRVIQALRQVVRAAGAAEGIKANVDVVE